MQTRFLPISRSDRRVVMVCKCGKIRTKATVCKTCRKDGENDRARNRRHDSVDSSYFAYRNDLYGDGEVA